MKTPILMIATVTLLTLSACGRDDEASSQPTATGKSKTSHVAVDKQEWKAPCDWLTPEEAAAAFGKLAGEPYRAMNTENARADAAGVACAYPVTTDRGVGSVALQVDPSGAPELESASSTMANVVAREISEDGHGEPPVVKQRTDGWDVADWIAGERLYRVGHVAIRIGDRSSLTTDESLDHVALLLRERMADKPFLNPSSAADEAGSEPDPCALLTRAEAEAVLGPLSVAPYRSLKWSAIADGNGPSCTYYTPGHRAFVVHPTYSDGKDRFQMIAGLGNLFRSGLGGADEGDLLEGPWDAATAGTTGGLCFLKADTMLEVIYKSSATDMEGAVKLAAIAMPRTAKIGATR